MTNEEIIIQRLNVLTTFMNNVRTLSKKIFQLPPSTDGVKWIATYNETSDENEKFNLTEALGSVYSLTDGLRVIGNIVRDGADFTFEVGFEWKINGIEYSNAEITRTINDAGTGNHRIDIAVCDTNNDIYIIEGFEVPLATAVVQPPTPPNTLFICYFLITESVIGDNSTPGITGQNNIPLYIEIASLTDANISTFVSYINTLSTPLVISEYNSLVEFKVVSLNTNFRLVGIGKGTYGLGQTQIAPENVMKITFSGGSQDIDETLGNGDVALDKTMTLDSTPDGSYDIRKTELVPGVTRNVSKEVESSKTYYTEVSGTGVAFYAGDIDTAQIIPTLDGSGNIVASVFKLPPTTGEEIGATREWAQQLLDAKADLVGGLVPSSQLPVLVDEMLEGTYINATTFNNLSGVAYTPTSNNYYVDTTTNKTYRWSGSAYVALNEGLALGETSSTAYRGDRGKTAYDHSQETGNPHGTTAAQVGAYSTSQADELFDIKNTELNLLNDYSLSSITTAQKLFNVGTSGNGAFSLDANSLYEFEMFVYLDNLSTTSSSFSFQILGTATYSNILLRSEASKQAFITGSIFNGIITATTSYTLVTNSIASTGLIKITGSFRTSSAGTFIPSILLSVANAANVKKGSYAKIKKIGADTFTATSGIS